MMMAKLGEVCTVVSGTTPNSGQPEYWNGNLNWITPAELTDEIDVIYETQRKITEQAVIDRKLKSFPAGTVLLSSRAPIGKVAIAGIEMYCNQGFKNLICSDRIYNRYLYYFLKDKTDYLNSLGRGATFKEISKSIVENIEIPLPTLDEQHKIAAVLDKVSDLIAKRRQQLDKLDEMVKARFVEMFGTLMNPKDEFSVVSIKDVCSLIKDGTHQTPTYTEDKEGGFKFLSSKDVMTQKIEWDNIKYITADLHEKLYAKIQPKRNDILMSKNGVNYGIAAVNDTDEIFDIYVSLALLRPKEKINPIYFRCAINNPDTKWQFDRHIKGIGVPNLHLSEIKRTRILLPPLELQNKFVDFVEQIEKMKTLISCSLEKLETLKKSLMQEYFG